MNFKPLENERQYKVTKKYLKKFRDNWKTGEGLNLTTNEYKLLMESQCGMINILEAEVQDYEHRNK